MQIGIGLAVAAALLTNLASLFKHRGCHHAAPVRLQEPLRSARNLASSPWFAAGWGIAAVAWFVHVAALSMAPISIVQAVLAGYEDRSLLEEQGQAARLFFSRRFDRTIATRSFHQVFQSLSMSPAVRSLDATVLSPPPRSG